VFLGVVLQLLDELGSTVELGADLADVALALVAVTLGALVTR
jgi:hypothetical protein